MKKVFITLVAFLAISSTVMAAGHVDSVRYLTTKAWKNWFISVDGNIDWWKGSDTTPFNGADPVLVATSMLVNGSPIA